MPIFLVSRFLRVDFLRSFLDLAAFAIIGLLLMTQISCAQTAAATVNTFDLSPWLQILIGIATASIPVVLALLAAWAKAHFKMAAGSNAAAILDFLVTSSSQTVVSALAKAPASLKPFDVKNATVAGILNDLSATTLAAMTLKNVTPAAIAARIDGAVQIALTVPAPATSTTK